MNILFVCENYIPHYGGAEVVFKNLAEGYVGQGHKVIVVTQLLPETTKYEVINGVKVVRINSFGSRNLFTFLSIPKVLNLAKKCDVIQTTSFNGAPPAWLVGKLRKKKVAITVHEVWIGKWQQVTSLSTIKAKIHDILERMIYWLPYNKYICVSDATKNDLLKIGIKPNKVQRVHNGVEYQFWNPDKFEDRTIEIRNRFNVQNNFVYFSWGRPGTSKGHEYLIKAVPKIKEKIPDAKLLLMLSTSEQYKKKYAELVQLVNSLGLQDDVKIIPPVKHLELGYYLKAFDCAVIPSIAEGFGFNCAEAMTMGIPVVVSDAGSLPEVVSGKHLVFKSKDIEDLAKKVIMISKGKWNEIPLKRFEWKTSVDKYLKVYGELTK
jgi:D-inositol-3-phosphate glycosyltransferase